MVNFPARSICWITGGRLREPGHWLVNNLIPLTASNSSVGVSGMIGKYMLLGLLLAVSPVGAFGQETVGKPAVDVRDRGAKCDGRSDDAVAFNAALAAADPARVGLASFTFLPARRRASWAPRSFFVPVKTSKHNRERLRLRPSHPIQTDPAQYWRSLRESRRHGTRIDFRR